MFKLQANKLSNLLINNHLINPGEIEYYSYGFEHLLLSAIMYAAIIVISIITNTFFISLIFTITFSILRRLCGGYHCNSPMKCIVFSLSIYCVLLVMLQFSGLILWACILAFSILAMVPIFLFAPVESMNNPLTVLERKKYRIISLYLTFFFETISVLLFILQIYTVFYPISYALIIISLLIIISNKGGSHEKTNIKNSCVDS